MFGIDERLCTLPTAVCLRYRYPSTEADGLLVWDDLVFQREQFASRIKDFFAAKSVPPTSPVMTQLRAFRRATYERACESALKQRVFSVSAVYHRASLEVNKEVCARLCVFGRWHV